MKTNSKQNLIKLKRWKQENKNHKIYFGSNIIAISNGEKTVAKFGNDLETMAKAVLKEWNK